MSSPMDASTSAATSAASQPQHEEENADEVKIFRTDVDDTNNDEPLDDELAADKTDVAFEADTDIGERSAFSGSQQSANLLSSAADLATRQRAFAVLASMAFPSPGYLAPFLRPPFSPLSPFYQPSPLANLAQLMNSPSHTALYAAAALSGGAFNVGNVFGAFGNAPVLQTMPNASSTAGAFGAASCNNMSTMRMQSSTPTRISALNSPVSSMAAGLNGISLLERSQQRNNAYKSAYSTPKRGTVPYGVQSAPGSATASGDAQSPRTPKREKGASREEKAQHIKKPCNAFMWYMKLNRRRLLAEQGGQQVQSATINRRLGEEWQKLSKSEQQKYFDLASKEREEHQKAYPDWTARDNYAIKKNKKKKLREKSSENNELKKCRARFGLENMNRWCKHCKRKKRCLNVRETESPSHVISSTTNPPGMSCIKPMLDGLQRPMGVSAVGSGTIGPPLQTLNTAGAGIGAHISSSSSTASSSTVSRHLDSPSSSGVMSVGKRTESNASSNFDAGTPPPASSASSTSAAAAVAAAAAAAAQEQHNNTLGFLQSLQNHHPLAQFASAFAAGGLATPKAENQHNNPFFSANSTPLAPTSTATGVSNHHDDTEMPKPTPTHLLTQLNPFVAAQNQQQQNQFFNNLNFNGMTSNHNFMAAYAAAAQNLK